MTESKADAARRAMGSQIEHKPRVADAVGTVVGRRYEITELLGAGRRGRVYVARDRLTDTTVALKRFRTDTPKLRQAAELSMAAAEIVAGLRHEHIVRVFDVGEDAAGPYIVSEYIDGPDAAKLVASQGAMGLRQAAKIIETIGQAVSFAHDRNLFHGSVRGSNILFAEGSKPMLCDFSLGEIDKGDRARALRQDVKSLVRTLCQLLTGVSSGSVGVRDLPDAVQSAVRATLGTGVTSSQPTIGAFLRELRATELDLAAAPEVEQDAVDRGRRAELSGSFIAMREAGRDALEKNGESAEAMVLLRRADQLHAERDDLMESYHASQSSLDYAGALESLSKMLKRFPADHQVQKLASKRETLAELTRLTGIAEQLGAAGHVAASLDSWRRITQLSPSDERAATNHKLAARARMKKRVVSGAGSLVVVLAVAGAGGYWAWESGLFGAAPVVPGLAAQTPTSDADSPENSELRTSGERLDAMPAIRNPLVRSRDEAGAQTPSVEAAPVETTADSGSGEASGTKSTATLNTQAAAMAKRDSLSAKRHAEQLGAPGLAPAEFASAMGAFALAESLLTGGSYVEAAEKYEQARNLFVSSVARAGGVVAGVHESITARRFREASASILELGSALPSENVAALARDMESARTQRLELSPKESIDLQYIEPGVFSMGSSEDEDGRRFGEDISQVRIAEGYWLARTELTRGQLAAIRGGPEPSQPGLPAVGITLDEARTVAELLSDRLGGTFSVPTEAQWEYACRADREFVDDAGWSVLDSAGLPQEPGAFGANPWGLVDMIGNAAELVISDTNGHNDSVVMTRGGSYLSTMPALRAAARHELVQRARTDVRVGLRLAWTGMGKE